MADRERQAVAAIARESSRRVELEINAPECISCDAPTDGKSELCRSCLKEMAAERAADAQRDEPDARAERILRMLEES